MRYLVTGDQMKAADRHTIEQIGVPSVVLMERAALAVAEETLALLRPGQRVLAVCGTGNNGADGIAAARILFLRGWKTTLLLAGDPDRGTEEYRLQRKIAENLGMNIIPSGADRRNISAGDYGVVIDALFGVGLSREVGGEYRELIDFINGLEARIVAVDLPSGIHADTGAVMGAAVEAEVTVTFGYEKLGSALYPGRGCCGRLVIADIGLAPPAWETGAAAFTYEPKDLARIPERPAYSNKGTFGKVLIAAGSKNMSGAAYLSALACYRMGAGLVRIFTPEENREILQQQLPEAVITAYSTEEAENMSGEFQALIKAQCDWAEVIVLGPGISRGPWAHKLVAGFLSNAFVPILLDADGLNAVAEHPYLTRYFTENIVITPHLGEMARLTGKTVAELKGDLVSAAREYADRYGITCVLKEAATVAALRDGRTYVNASGNSAMAKAGSGDVLTGVIAGLLAMGMEEAESAAMGVYVHGLAGDAARKSTGEYGLLARELADRIPEAVGL